LCVDENVVEATQPGDGVVIIDGNLDYDVDKTIVEPIETWCSKRVVYTLMRQAQEKKENRLTMAQQLEMQINRLCSAVKLRSIAITTTSKVNERLCLYNDLIDMLDTIPKIIQDEKLYFFVISHFKEKKDNRQVFMSLKSDSLKVKYLKYEFEESHS